METTTTMMIGSGTEKAPRIVKTKVIPWKQRLLIPKAWPLGMVQLILDRLAEISPPRTNIDLLLGGELGQRLTWLPSELW